MLINASFGAMSACIMYRGRRQSVAMSRRFLRICCHCSVHFYHEIKIEQTEQNMAITYAGHIPWKPYVAPQINVFAEFVSGIF